jgi:hypothetical protein
VYLLFSKSIPKTAAKVLIAFNKKGIDSLKTKKIDTLESKLHTTKVTRNILGGASLGLFIITLILIL